VDHGLDDWSPTIPGKGKAVCFIMARTCTQPCIQKMPVAFFLGVNMART
jgi:hypothetical protein